MNRRRFLYACSGVAISSRPVRSSAADETSIWFVRHGESEGNVALRATVPDNGMTYPLTHNGLLQAKALGEQFRDVRLSGLLSSTRLRAIQTADAIAFVTEAVVELYPELVEVDFGEEYASWPSEVRARKLSETYAAWRGGDLNAKVGDSAESLSMLLGRFIPTVKAAIAKCAGSGKPLVFVSHGGLLRLCSPFLFGNVSQDFAAAHPLPNAGVVRAVSQGEILTCTEWVGVKFG